MNRIYIKPLVFLLFVLVQASSFAQTINVQVNVDINNLHNDTKSILVVCELIDDGNTFQGYKKLSVNNSRTIDLVEVPVVIKKDLSQNALLSCQLKMCQAGSSIAACKSPLGTSKAEKIEQYRTFDESANNVFSATQRINGQIVSNRLSLSTFEVDRDSSVASVTSTINSGLTSISTGTVAVQGSTQTTAIGTGAVVESDVFNPVIIDVGEMTGTGTRFEPVTINVSEMTGTGTRFEPVTINVGEMTGTGTRFEPVIINVGEMVGVGSGNEIKITLNKAGNGSGRIMAIANNSSIAAICRVDCSSDESDLITLGSSIFISAYAEDSAGVTIDDGRSVFTGWSGSEVCAQNANGNQIQFTINESVNCIATFDFVTPERVSVSMNKKVNGQASAKNLVKIMRTTDASGAHIMLGSAEVVSLMLCNEGCTGKISGQFPASAFIAMSAIADNLHQFDGWSGDSECSGSSNAPRVIITPNQNIDCTANFSLRPVTGHTLRLGKAGSGKGSLSVGMLGTDTDSCNDLCQSRGNSYTIADCDSDCSNKVVNSLTTWSIYERGLTDGVRVSLTAIPDEGSIFAGFVGDCSEMTMDSGNQTGLVMIKDSYCAARFNKETGSNNNDPQLIIDSLEPIIEFEVEPNIDPGTLNINPNFQLNQ